MEPEPPYAAAVQGITTDDEWLANVSNVLVLDHVDLPQDEHDQLRAVVAEFSQLFALDNTELGQTSTVTHTINTGDSPSMRQPPRRVPFSLRGKVGQLIVDMFEQGVIVPSSSPRASPIDLVRVAYRGGGWRPGIPPELCRSNHMHALMNTTIRNIKNENEPY